MKSCSYVIFCDWHLSPSIMFSGFILLLLVSVLYFFLLLNNNSFIVNIRIDLAVFDSAILAFCFLSLYFIYPSVPPLLLSFAFMAILHCNIWIPLMICYTYYWVIFLVITQKFNIYLIKHKTLNSFQRDSILSRVYEN